MDSDLPDEPDAAIEALFRLHAAPLLQLAFLLVGEEATAHDVVLNSFADLWVRRRYRDGHQALDQLRAAVVCRSRVRRSRVRRSRARRSGSCPPNPASELAALTARQRETFVLSWWLGLSAAEIGELLRLSPRPVQRAIRDARSRLPTEDELAEALTATAAAVELSYDALGQVRERTSAQRRRRRRRVGAGLAAAAILIAALGASLWATRSRPYSSPTGRQVFVSVVPVAELASFDVGTGKPRGDLRLGAAQSAASLPAGRWLVARVDPGCRSSLSTLRPDGSSSRLPGSFLGRLSSLAVSPNGRYAAGVVSLCRDPAYPRLDVIDLSSGRRLNEWRPPPPATSISGLSWAPDNRRVAYTLGSGVSGRGAGYGVVDIRERSGLLAPTKPPARVLDVGGRSCQVVRSLWLGRTGRFAVFAACVDRNELLLVQVPPDPAVAQHGAVLATLPGSALTLGVDASATSDGRHLLVTTDVATYRVDGSRVTRLADARPSPAW